MANRRRRQRFAALAAVSQQSQRSGLPELTRRLARCRQLIRENGVTYNVYGDPRGMDGPGSWIRFRC